MSAGDILRMKRAHNGAEHMASKSILIKSHEHGPTHPQVAFTKWKQATCDTFAFMWVCQIGFGTHPSKSNRKKEYTNILAWGRGKVGL